MCPPQRKKNQSKTNTCTGNLQCKEGNNSYVEKRRGGHVAYFSILGYVR